MIINDIPKGFTEGVIIYKKSDTSIFVFSVKDYLKSTGEIDISRLDSSWHKDYLRLKDTLNDAINNQYIIVGDIYAKTQMSEWKIFPNPFVLSMDLI